MNHNNNDTNNNPNMPSSSRRSLRSIEDEGTGGQGDASQAGEDRCVLCLGEKRSPVYIPCGHSFCLSCLNNFRTYQKYRWAHRCPICRLAIREHCHVLKRHHSVANDSSEVIRNRMRRGGHDERSPMSVRYRNRLSTGSNSNHTRSPTSQANFYRINEVQPFHHNMMDRDDRNTSSDSRLSVRNNSSISNTNCSCNRSGRSSSRLSDVSHGNIAGTGNHVDMNTGETEEPDVGPDSQPSNDFPSLPTGSNSSQFEFAYTNSMPDNSNRREVSYSVQVDYIYFGEEGESLFTTINSSNDEPNIVRSVENEIDNELISTDTDTDTTTTITTFTTTTTTTDATTADTASSDAASNTEEVANSEDSHVVDDDISYISDESLESLQSPESHITIDDNNTSTQSEDSSGSDHSSPSEDSDSSDVILVSDSGVC